MGKERVEKREREGEGKREKKERGKSEPGLKRAK